MSLREELFRQIEELDRFTVITLIEVHGSAPREVGARMIVTEQMTSGSIGGGNLEFQAIHHARELLAQSQGCFRKIEFAGLGITLKQCCGGAVQLMYEVFSGPCAVQLVEDVGLDLGSRPRFLLSCVSDNRPAAVISRRTDLPDLPDAIWDAAQGLLANSSISSRLISTGSTQWFITYLNEPPTKVVVFGAGHVGKALIKIMEELPFQIDWVDQRDEMFPTDLPDNTTAQSPDDLFAFIDHQSSDVLFAVMTHDHGLDYALCLHILKQQHFSWLGLIGSITKRRRFEQRLLSDGVDPLTVQRLVCPIGQAEIRSKIPTEIALSIAAQLLAVHHRRRADASLAPRMPSAEGQS